jgi:ribosome-binding protein aMBF1 (putative translation factor)
MGVTDNVRQQIEQVRREKNLTHEDLAAMIAIDRPNLTRMLSGTSGKLPKKWQALLDALGLELKAVPKGQGG